MVERNAFLIIQRVKRGFQSYEVAGLVDEARRIWNDSLYG
jgi:hypothetical protein